jgi:hypothetical protein
MFPVLFGLPVDGLTTLTAYIGTVAVDIWPYAALAAGIPLSFYVIKKIISLVAGRAR